MSINDDKSIAEIRFADHQLIFSSLGALYWQEHELLVISDLHLEKGSYHAQRGSPLPLYDSLDTLQRLKRVINTFQPKKVLSLGDNIHDDHAFTRMNKDTKKLLEYLTQEVDEWIWIMGNHDRQVTPELNSSIHFYSHLQLGAITFSHDFREEIPYQIVGHYHPKVRIKNISGKCFLYNNNKIIMPSFGSYTGGFDIDSARFKQITHNEVFQAYLLNKEKMWRVK